MKRRALVVISGILAVWFAAVCIRLVTSRIDYARLQSGQEPIFSIKAYFYLDGGSVGYQGFGYELVDQRRLAMHVGDTWEQNGLDIGPVLRYQWGWLLLPLPDRSRVTWVPMATSQPTVVEIPSVIWSPPASTGDDSP